MTTLYFTLSVIAATLWFVWMVMYVFGHKPTRFAGIVMAGTIASMCACEAVRQSDKLLDFGTLPPPSIDPMDNE